jgi:tetratricopeptide (TPR) repeat protein
MKNPFVFALHRLRRLSLCGALLFAVAAACAGSEGSSPVGLAGFGAPDMAIEAPDEGNSALGNYLAGTYALEIGQLDEAASFFESALAEDPDNLELLRQLQFLSLASGRYDAALEQAETLAERDLQSDEALLLLALEEARAGDFAATHELLQKLDHEGIANLTVPFIDAWALFGTGGEGALDRSLARLQQGESLGALNGYHRAMLLDLGGRLDEARQTLSEAMPDSGPAPLRMVQAYASMLARSGQTAAATELVRAQLADRRDQPVFEELLRTLERGEAPEPPFTNPTGGMADALLGIAEALRQEGGSAHAVVYARLAAFLRPELAEAALLIGDVVAEQDNYDAAIEAYGSVDPDSPIGHVARLRMARVLHVQDKPEEAYETLEQLAEEGERIDALVQLGDLLRRDEHYARAESAYSRAIERLGEPEREHWTLFYARGITYERTKRWPEAEADFLRALELEPEQPFVLNYLGYSWVDMGMHLDQAKGMLNRAVELRPNDGFIVDSMGWVHYRLGDFRAAVEMLERAVELEPGDPVINDHLGDAYWRVGRTREARFQWQRALSLDPEEEAVAEIEQKLKSGLPQPAGATSDRT